MKRQLALLDHALGAVQRRGSRSLALGMGVGLLVFLLASVLWITSALRAEFAAGAVALPDLTVQRLRAGRPALLHESDAAPLAAIPGVASVQARVWGYYYAPALGGNLTIVGIDPRDDRKLAGLGKVVRGRAIAADGQGEMVLGEALARFLGVRIGESFALPVGKEPRFLRLVGVFRSASALRTADLLLTSTAEARHLLDMRPGEVTDLALSLSNPNEARVAAQKLVEFMPGVRVLDRELLKRTYDLTFDARSGLLAMVLLPALAAFLLLAWDRLSSFGSAERREVALLRIMGWETGDIIVVQLWANLLVGLAGALGGALLAYAYVFLARAPGLAGAILGWSAIHPPFALVPQVTMVDLVSLLLMVNAPLVALGVVPAWRAAVADPAELLRGQA